MTITRRDAIAGIAAAPFLLSYGRAAPLPGRPLFTLGVASGEPEAGGAVLWTRLAPEPMAGDGGMPARPVAVRWEVYADDAARRIVRSGEAAAHPAFGHSVHAEVDGLEPGRPYWFRFFAGGQASAIGRTRTAPAAGSTPDRLRFCFGSCQKYENGRYGAWANVVADDPDLVVFLGDYIYEAAPSVGTPRVHLNPEPVDLAGYRVRYATYRLDPQLQAAHAAAPWLVTWDDHEVANDYAGLLDQEYRDPAWFERRRAAAYRAYYEFMPLRAAARPRGSAMRLYRSVDWGSLAQFQIIDDRQYRSGRACHPASLLAEHRRGPVTVPMACPDLADPRRSMLGRRQEHWLDGTLAASKAGWNILAQQTQMTPYRRREPDGAGKPEIMATVDTWDGYPASRDRILDSWQRHGTANPMVIAGDIHAFVASDLRCGDAVVAPCFVGGSITTWAGDRNLASNTAGDPAYRFANNSVRGYGRVDLTPARADVRFRALRDPLDAGTQAYDLAAFTVEAKPIIRA